MIRDKRVLRLIGKYLRRRSHGGGSGGGAARKARRKAGRCRRCWPTFTWTRWIEELEQRGHQFSRYADDCNIYVSSQRAAERVLASIQDWIEKHLRLEVNATKSGTGRAWERKFLGFRLNREGDRSRPGECGAIQNEGPGVMAKLPEPNQ